MNQAEVYADRQGKSTVVSPERPKQTPTYKSNIFGPPSLTPGIKYPITEEAERIRQLAYSQGYSDAMRMNRAGRLVEDDPFLDVLRKRVEQIRKEKIKKGRIEPATKQERKWRLGL